MRNYNELTLPHLRSICHDHGLHVSGTKKYLVIRLVKDYIKRFRVENGPRNEIELEIQIAKSNGNPDVVKLEEKLAVYDETMISAYEQRRLVHLLEVKRLEGVLARKIRQIEAAEEALRMYDEKKAAENTS
jgi:predicted nucleotidyltransferase component of viral defense system